MKSERKAIRRSSFRARQVVLTLGVLASVGCGSKAPVPIMSTPKPSANAPMEMTTTDLEARHAELLAKNPKGVRLVVSTESDRKRFAEGEIIQLELAFSSSVPAHYALDLATYDRSGRLPSESFLFAPSDRVVDPLRDYFEGRGGMYGGLRPAPVVLSPTPRSVRVVLNEWARFGGPGKYRVIVQSTRVFTTTGEAPSQTTEDRSATAENILELDIVANEAWAKDELSRVEGVLLAGGDEDTVGRARYALRFLTSPAATRAKVDDLCRVDVRGDQVRWNTEAGLYAVADRAGVISMLEAGLGSPTCAVTKEYLALLTRFKGIALGLPYGDPNYASKVEEPLFGALLTGLSTKSDEALPITLFTALAAVGDREKGRGAKSAEADALRRRLAGTLAKLPERSLQSLLGDAWALVRSPVMGPALLALVKEARPRGGQLRSTSDLALERLLELDYASSRTFIIDELGRGARTSFSGATLARLKDKELPAVEAALARGLRAPETDGESLELRAEIFARYATKASLQEAWTAWRAIPYFRVSLLSYLSRHDAKAANTEIARIQDIDSLRRLSLVMWSPALEAAVTAKIATPGGAQAAQLLGERGGPQAEKALWASLKGAKPDQAQAIRRALSNGNAWMLPPDRLRALAATCADESCKRDVGHLLDRWGAEGTRPAFVLWSVRPSGGVTGWLGHYDLRSLDDVERRIGQLPKGVSLAWQTKADDVDPEVLAKVRAWAAAKKIDLVSMP